MRFEISAAEMSLSSCDRHHHYHGKGEKEDSNFQLQRSPSSADSPRNERYYCFTNVASRIQDCQIADWLLNLRSEVTTLGTL